jgi:hypothetical protein
VTTWIQDMLPGMEFLAEPEIDPIVWGPSSCPGCDFPDMEHFALGESCD